MAVADRVTSRREDHSGVWSGGWSRGRWRGRIAKVMLTGLLGVVMVCTAGCASGGTAERIGPGSIGQGVPPEQMLLYHDVPRQPHRKVVRLSAEEVTSETRDEFDAESAAYNTLRRLAARHGAQAITEIVRTRAVDESSGVVTIRLEGFGVVFSDAPPAQR